MSFKCAKRQVLRRSFQEFAKRTVQGVVTRVAIRGKRKRGSYLGSGGNRNSKELLRVWPSVANTNVVPNSVTNVSSESHQTAISKQSLIKFSRKTSPLIKLGSLFLVAWLVSGQIWRQRDYRKGLQTLSSVPEEKALHLLTNRPGESGLAGVIENKLIPLDVM